MKYHFIQVAPGQTHSQHRGKLFCQLDGILSSPIRQLKNPLNITVVSKTQLHCGPAPPSVSLIDGIAPNIDSAYGSFSVKIFPLTSVGSVPVIFP